MSKRSSIYLGQELAEVLSALGADTDNGMRSRSSTINALADRYREVCKRSIPPLRLGEWMLLFDSLNGVWMQDQAAIAINGVLPNTADAIQMDRLDQKWEIDGPALLSKLEGMGFCQLLAVVDATERFWAECDGQAIDNREAVTRTVGSRALID